jgi:hypothetical protein
VFLAVKIETPRDANTHDGHVKRRGSPPRPSHVSPDSAGCQRAVHGSFSRTRASQPSLKESVIFHESTELKDKSIDPLSPIGINTLLLVLGSIQPFSRLLSQ